MGDDEVRLAFTVRAVVADDPGDVLEEDVLGRERGTQAVVDVVLGALRQAFARRVGHGRLSTAAAS